MGQFHSRLNKIQKALTCRDKTSNVCQQRRHAGTHTCLGGKERDKRRHIHTRTRAHSVRHTHTPLFRERVILVAAGGFSGVFWCGGGRWGRNDGRSVTRVNQRACRPD